MKRFVLMTAMLFCAAIVGCNGGENGNEGGGETNGTSQNGNDAENAKSSGGGGSTDLVGEIKIAGSSTVAPITTVAKDYFKEKYPNVDVQIAVTGTGGGFKRFTVGETDISNASRPIKPDELAICKENGIKFIELPVAYDGLTIAIHPDNDWATELTLDQIKKMFAKSQAAKTWKAVDESWPDEEIKFYIPGKDSGTFDYFKEVVGGKEDDIREDVTPSEDDHQLIAGIARDKYAIGFFGVAYYAGNKDKVKAVSVVNPDTNKAEMPTPEAIESGEYAPFSRPLFIYVAEKSAGASHIKRFVENYLTQAGEYATEAKYVALPESVYKEAMVHFRAKITGTHYLTSDGKKRSGAVTEVYKEANATN